MRSYVKELFVLIALTLILFNTVQHSRAIYENAFASWRWSIYSIGSIVLAVLFFYQVFKSIAKNGILSKLIKSFRGLQIPRVMKSTIVVVFLGNIIAIGLAEPIYPFYDVGMFRWSSKLNKKSKILYNPQYYYYKDDVLHILELRKEGFTFLAEHFKQGYTHEFTFATAFHNKGQKENYDFIAKKMKEEGVDTLWVGIHSVNYATGEVLFDPDICKAIDINQTKKIHYGPIYIPDYQKLKCTNGN